MDSAVKENIRQSAAQLKASVPIFSEKANTGHLQTDGVFYDLDSEEVKWFL